MVANALYLGHVINYGRVLVEEIYSLTGPVSNHGSSWSLTSSGPLGAARTRPRAFAARARYRGRQTRVADPWEQS